MRHDGLTISESVEKKVPRTYQLQNGWTVSKSGLSLLRRGPLLSESGETLEVPAYGRIVGLVVRFERPLFYADAIASMLVLLLALLVALGLFAN